jgi:hypothetical protein
LLAALQRLRGGRAASSAACERGANGADEGSSIMKLLRLCCCLVSISLVAACGDDDDFEDDYYDDLDDAAYSTVYYDDWSTSMVYGVTDPFEDPYYYDDAFFLTVSNEAPVGDPDAVAVIVADNVDQYFVPADCANIMRDGSELTYTLSNCTGPFGRRTIDGGLRVSFSDDDGQIAFEIASEDLRIDGESAELDLSGAYSAEGTVKTVQYTSSWSLPARGRDASGESDNTLTWTSGSNCITRNGTGELMTSQRSFEISVQGYARCAAACPSAGAVTMISEEQTSTLTFDGTAQANLRRSDGTSAQIPLDCQ